MTKPIDALKTIARYVEAKKPKTLAEAEHMLDLDRGRGAWFVAAHWRTARGCAGVPRVERLKRSRRPICSSPRRRSRRL
jgi:hypothetical protein